MRKKKFQFQISQRWLEIFTPIFHRLLTFKGTRFLQNFKALGALNLDSSRGGPHKISNFLGYFLTTYQQISDFILIQLAQLIFGRFAFYAMIRGYFNLLKVALKVMLPPWASGSKQILIELSNDLI